jgi:dTDP-4-dehydrorhamnose 3,5-epimerase
MITSLKIKDSFLIDHQCFSDERGYFSEYLQHDFRIQNLGNFIQQNLSQSKKYVLRGLHFQEGSFAQAKLLTVMKGSIYDFFIDLRSDSPTYLQSDVVFLTDSSLQSVYVPTGCAHGFFTLENDNRVMYSVSLPRSEKHERIINPIPLLESEVFKKRIPPLEIRDVTISNKDRNAITLEDYLKEK